jgi:predicted CDP-diglyceride synthetase/phosphatidate cytidylyltransferase
MEVHMNEFVDLDCAAVKRERLRREQELEKRIRFWWRVICIALGVAIVALLWSLFL